MKLNGVICRIRAEIDGVKYEPGPIKASEAERITAWTGYSLRDWEVSVVGEDDPVALKGLIALTRFRQGEHIDRFDSIDIDDLGSVTADFYDERGRKVEPKIGDDGRPVLLRGQSVLLFDGEEDAARPLESGSSGTP